jgi:hypothetical protein
LFPDTHLKLPGVVVLRRLATANDAIYVSLHGDVPTKSVVTRIRLILGIVAEQSAHGSDESAFSRATGLALAKAGVTYFRSGGVSIGERVVQLLRTLWDNRRDIMALIPGVGKALSKSRSGHEIET